MRIVILGTGYVGLSTGVCLAEIGHHVICIDVDQAKIELLKQGISPIYEPGLQPLLVKNAEAGRLQFTTSHQEGLSGADVIVLAVGTPQLEDGSADLSYLKQAAQDIAAHLGPKAIVVIKSTVPVGTNEYMKQLLLEYQGHEAEIHMVSNPEFLRQGSAISDTMNADRIIIGCDNQQAAEIIADMYQPLKVPYLFTTVKSAEMIKYGANAFLAMKISFINEIANLCEAVGADVSEVARGIGKDRRIGEAFLQPGIGYGGSCFPKDVKSLLHTSQLKGIPFSLLEETMLINEAQHLLLVNKALKRFGSLEGRKIALFGLAFKPETDDMREAPSIKIARSLIRHGAEVTAYDPVAGGNARKAIGDSITYCDSPYEAAAEADAVFIVTEWSEFIQLDLPGLSKTMKHPILFDGRNCLDETKVRACSIIEYYPVGKPAILNGK